MGATAVVNVKTGLRALLQANPNLDGVAVLYAWPVDDAIERETIWFGKARMEHDPGPMRAGRVHRNEMGDLDVIVDVIIPGGSIEEAETRVVALGLELEETVADNRNIGNATADGITVNATYMAGGGELLSGYLDAGSVARLMYVVHWDARLS